MDLAMDLSMPAFKQISESPLLVLAVKHAAFGWRCGLACEAWGLDKRSTFNAGLAGKN